MKKVIHGIAAICAAASISACSDTNECKQECVGNTAYTCQNGDTVKKDCGNDVCMNGVCIPQHVCDANVIRCNEGIPQKCENNAWVNQQACGANQVCKDGNCELNEQTESCENDKLQCSPAGVPQKCVSNAWLTQASCAEGTTCKDGICVKNTDKVCDENEKQCSNGVPQKCVSNAWVNQNACAEGTSCKDGDCVKNDSSDKLPREQLSCEKGEQAKCQKTSDGHVWAVVCHDGEVEDDDWTWPEDCTSVGLTCVSEKVQYSDNSGTYTDAWCKCNNNEDCKKAYPEENLLCIDNYCDIDE